MPYYKATLAGGESQRADKNDSKFVYRLGLNVHPNPDKTSDLPCGEGIHLAKSIETAFIYSPDATEVYEAKPGVILGEDCDKVRVAYCFITRKVPEKEISEAKRKRKEAKEKQLIEEKKRQEFITLYGCEPPSLPGEDWLKKHVHDITWEDYNKQTLTVVSGNSKLTLSAKMKAKDIRVALSVVRV